MQAAADKGLARLMAFLRDEIEVERQAEAERMRPRAIAAGPFSVYRCPEVGTRLLCLVQHADAANPGARRPNTNNPALQTTEDARAVAEAGGDVAAGGFAWIRTGHALAQRGPLIYMFGGTGRTAERLKDAEPHILPAYAATLPCIPLAPFCPVLTPGAQWSRMGAKAVSC